MADRILDGQYVPQYTGGTSQQQSTTPTYNQSNYQNYYAAQAQKQAAEARRRAQQLAQQRAQQEAARRQAEIQRQQQIAQQRAQQEAAQRRIFEQRRAEAQARAKAQAEAAAEQQRIAAVRQQQIAQQRAADRVAAYQKQQEQERIRAEQEAMRYRNQGGKPDITGAYSPEKFEQMDRFGQRQRQPQPLFQNTALDRLSSQLRPPNPTEPPRIGPPNQFGGLPQDYFMRQQQQPVGRYMGNQFGGFIPGRYMGNQFGGFVPRPGSPNDPFGYNIPFGDYQNIANQRSEVPKPTYPWSGVYEDRQQDYFDKKLMSYLDTFYAVEPEAVEPEGGEGGYGGYEPWQYPGYPTYDYPEQAKNWYENMTQWRI